MPPKKSATKKSKAELKTDQKAAKSVTKATKVTSKSKYSSLH